MKIKNIFIGIALVGMLSGCNGGNEYSSLSDDIANLEFIPIETNTGKTVFVKANGETVELPDSMVRVCISHEGLSAAMIGDKVGYLDPNGKWAIEPRFASASSFLNGRAWVALPDSGLMCIDTKGNVKLRAPHEVRSAECFVDGQCWVQEMLGIQQFMTDKGELSFSQLSPGVRITGINPKYTIVREGNNDFLYTTHDLMFTANAIMAYKNLSLVPGHDDELIVGNNGVYGLLKYGKEQPLINPQFDNLVADGDLFVYKKGDKWGWCDRSGTPIIKARFKEVTKTFGKDGFAIVTVSGEKWGVIDKKGEWTVPARYEGVMPAVKSHFYVKKDGQWGIVDSKGEFSAQPQFKDIACIGKVMLATSDGSNWGVIDINGKYLGMQNLRTPSNHLVMENLVAQSQLAAEPNMLIPALQEYYSLGNTSYNVESLSNLWGFDKDMLNSYSYSIYLSQTVEPNGLEAYIEASFTEPVVSVSHQRYSRKISYSLKNDLEPISYNFFITVPEEQKQKLKGLIEGIELNGFKPMDGSEPDGTILMLIMQAGGKEKTYCLSNPETDGFGEADESEYDEFMPDDSPLNNPQQ